ncbi:3-methyl-2-oxobutanoate hydroxymethyltransferase [Candidatus Kinetoplastibacterium blastocrithidii TCC012E]|uniref:3-methyl-2-oxobutanoate hydroxymethyltransferase n=1 Tax=Candidatus Kinetoplastidibacterium blastocrithidiae TCC012E TaxID=1208922 RepID=M1M4X2_9PROT|nr:3-methyl-2-oxobutanoate hydroxymethyltransferase [Candidatus Kinetoplastibacterium blastocrithidii]AFZ83303.1 3-methyl-2-oxobutanoate hydroxymethyltransferase [Candidatus Kinetoplastibacterium blastocrithidii (ex Strigomonas culicis)]AGF50119.1 3-methyl-2-oxobutanoate hydroxymethyltransferase [Candidatus Kinetoplastibacterium blastocrithidii TCC012E]
MTTIQQNRKNIPFIKESKGIRKLVMLTAYTSPVANHIDPYVDVILVGDSLGMVIYGFHDTLSVTLDMMIAHGAAVTRSSKQACIIVDMPFGTYQESKSQAFRNAARILSETKASGIKLEGGEEMVETIHFLHKRGIPVMGHIGLMPQKFNISGGFKALGPDQHIVDNIVSEAIALEQSGAFAIVLECVAEVIGRKVTEAVNIPVIGIGASSDCDGQVLVVDDILGMNPDASLKFVKTYASLGKDIQHAAKYYAEEVRSGIFPNKENYFFSKN